MNTVINIDMDKNCSRCGQPGACQNGLCLKCVGERLKHMPKSKKRRTKPTADLPHMEGPGVAPVRNPTLERLAVDWIDLKDKLEAVKEETDTARESW